MTYRDHSTAPAGAATVGSLHSLTALLLGVGLCALAVVGYRPAGARAAVAITNLNSSSMMGVGYSVNTGGTAAGQYLNGSNVQASIRGGSGTTANVHPVGSGLNHSQAIAINASGQVAGSLAGHVHVFGVNDRAFLRTGTTTTILPTINNGGTRAFALNDAGVVVGVSNGQAFKWKSGDASLTPLGFNGPAFGINSAGDIVGANNQRYRASTGTSSSFGLPAGAASGTARDINDSGAIVGSAFYMSDFSMRAYVFKDNDFTLLPSLGGRMSEALAVNNGGVVVGYSYISPTGFEPHAFAYHNGQVVDLNSLLPANSGWMLKEAYGINDNNEVVGYGTFNGVTSGFLLTGLPVPEPTALALLALGGLAMMRRRV